jgi:virginiamycin B lyase
MKEVSHIRTILSATFAATVLVGLLAPSAATAQSVQIQEWDVPWEQSRPRDPYVAPDGRIWFVGQRSDYAAVLDPATGEMTKYDLPEGAGPHNLVVAKDGFVWYAGNRQAHIGRLDPATGDIIKYPMPNEAARDPHTLIFDSKGDIWFTVQSGNFVGKLTMADKSIQLVAMPEESARPYGIVLDNTDRPWVALFGTDKLATVDPESMELTIIPLPRESARPRRIGLTPDQKIWYVDYADGMLGRYDPATKKFSEWPMPGGDGSRPYGMATDDQGRVWFVETGLQPNRFVGFDPASEEFFSIDEVESGGGTIRHMYYDAPNQMIWFGADANTVGRAQILPKTDS